MRYEVETLTNVTHPNNVDMRVDGHTLTIVVDLSRDLGPSKSGRSRIIATTAGNLRLPGGAVVGLNVYRSAQS